MFKNLLLTILLIFPMAAKAHSPLSSSSPENGASLDVSPAQIVMEFESPAKLVKGELKKSKVKQGNSFLGGLFSRDDSESIPLGESFLMSIKNRQIVPLPYLGEEITYFYGAQWEKMVM